MKLLFLLALLSGCALQTAQAQTPLAIQGSLRGPVQVVRVVDGDTVRITLDGREENSRLIGIDTPETVHPTRGVEPYGPEASAFTKSLLEGQQVFIEFDIEERDRFSRPLIYVYLEDPAGAWTYQALHPSEPRHRTSGTG